jgi:hypothetical protein
MQIKYHNIDILNQAEVNKKTRDIAMNTLQDTYMNASNIENTEKVPDVIQNTTKLVEKAIFDQFKKNPVEYTRAITKIRIFLNPKHYIGEFSNLFRSKALQNVYTPDRLYQLDITDMLPEVFLNPSVSTADKLYIYQSLSSTIVFENNNYIIDINNILNPTQRRLTYNKKPISSTIKMLDKNKRVVRDLCSNPYWKMKEVNMIICKDNGKFYCLDIEKLIAEIAEKNTATNYFTKKILAPEVIDNLRNRYKDEIEELKQNHKIEIGERNNSEIASLFTTLDKLQELYDVFNTPNILEDIKTFYDLNVVENPIMGGKKGILSVLPTMIRERFNNYLKSAEDPDEAIKKINDWLLENISFIDKAINEPEETSSKIEAEINFKEEAKQSATFNSGEEDYIKQEILKEGTISSEIYNKYINRLESMHEAILKDLKIATAIPIRNNLTTLLTDVNTQLKNLRMKGRSIRGVISLLESKLENVEKKLVNVKESIGMEKIYPPQKPYMEQEKRFLQNSSKNIKQELEHLKGL